MSEHTRGPWRADIHPIIDIYIRRTDEEAGGVVATAYKHFGPEEGEANAHLIAAAPDLLEAAKGALARYPELNTLKAAVEKAEGKE